MSEMGSRGTGLRELTTLEWARERLANSARIALEKVGADRESWLEDVSYWRDIVRQLRELDAALLSSGDGGAHVTKEEEDTRMDRQRDAEDARTAAPVIPTSTKDPGTAPHDVEHRKLKACEAALFYIGRQIQENPDVRYYIGFGTQSFHLVTVAIATLTEDSECRSRK